MEFIFKVSKDMNSTISGAPRLLQSIAKDDVLPFLRPFQVLTRWNEPFRWYFLDFGVYKFTSLILTRIRLTIDVTMSLTAQFWWLSKKADVLMFLISSVLSRALIHGHPIQRMDIVVCQSQRRIMVAKELEIF